MRRALPHRCIFTHLTVAPTQITRRHPWPSGVPTASACPDSQLHTVAPRVGSRTTDSLEPHTTAAEFPAEQNIRRRSPHSPWATSGRTFATGCLESVPFFGPHLSSPSFLPAPARHHSLAQPGTWPASHNGPLQDGIVFGFGGFRESSESCPCSIKRSILGS